MKREYIQSADSNMDVTHLRSVERDNEELSFAQAVIFVLLAIGAVLVVLMVLALSRGMTS